MAAISLRTLTGTQTFGPVPIGTHTRATITLDRTVAGGINSLTAASTLGVNVESSRDGTTWNGEGSTVLVCGPTVDYRTGLPLTSWNMQISGVDPAAVDIRVTTVASDPVAVAGSLVAS